MNDETSSIPPDDGAHRNPIFIEVADAIRLLDYTVAKGLTVSDELISSNFLVVIPR